MTIDAMAGTAKLVLNGSGDTLTYITNKCLAQQYQLTSNNVTNGTENGYQWIDLGLSVLWATCNVGATKPEEYGDYYAWGEVDTYYEPGYAQEKTNTHWKSNKEKGYAWESYKWCDGSGTTINKYNNNDYYGLVDNKRNLDINDDVAHIKWGGNWRMPTLSDFDELYEWCTRSWEKNNNVWGIRFTSERVGYEGFSIFLPASGARDGNTIEYLNSGGFYWETTILDEQPSRACGFAFIKDKIEWRSPSRVNGLTVRAVCPKK